MTPIVAAFLAGRLISYTLWVNLAHVASHRFEDLFTAHLQHGGALGLELLALAALVIFTRIDWPRVLQGRSIERVSAQG